MRGWLIAGTIVYVALLLPSIAAAPLAALLHDDPQAGGALLWITTVLWITTPLTLITSIAGSWVSWRWRARRPTIIFLSLPVVHLAVLLLSVLAMTS